MNCKGRGYEIWGERVARDQRLLEEALRALCDQRDRMYGDKSRSLALAAINALDPDHAIRHQTSGR